MVYKVERILNNGVDGFIVKEYRTPELKASDISARWAFAPKDSKLGTALAWILAAWGLNAEMQDHISAAVCAVAFDGPGLEAPCADCGNEVVPCFCDIGG